MYATAPLAVIEIGSRVVAIMGAAFLGTFAVVCVVGWRFLRSGSPEPEGTKSWSFDVRRQITMSKPTYDKVSSLTKLALSRPGLTPEKRAALDQLDSVRDALARVYRVVMIMIGLVGIAGATALFGQADDGNMLLLPAGIILLLSLGAILEGVVPSRRFRSSKPFDTSFLDRINVHVTQNPITINLDETDLSRAAEMLRNGSTPDEVVRAMYPAYDELGEIEKNVVKESMAQALAQVMKR